MENPPANSPAPLLPLEIGSSISVAVKLNNGKILLLTFDRRFVELLQTRIGESFPAFDESQERIFNFIEIPSQELMVAYAERNFDRLFGSQISSVFLAGPIFVNSGPEMNGETPIPPEEISLPRRLSTKDVLFSIINPSGDFVAYLFNIETPEIVSATVSYKDCVRAIAGKNRFRK